MAGRAWLEDLVSDSPISEEVTEVRGSGRSDGTKFRRFNSGSGRADILILDRGESLEDISVDENGSKWDVCDTSRGSLKLKRFPDNKPSKNRNDENDVIAINDLKQASDRRDASALKLKKANGLLLGEKQHVEFDGESSFLLDPMPEKSLAMCNLVRGPIGTGSSKYNGICMYLERGDRPRKLIMIAKRRVRGKTVSFVIADSAKSMAKKLYLGKVRAPLGGSEWTLYDNGVKPGQTRGLFPERKVLGQIGFVSRRLGHRGPREISVSIPGTLVEPLSDSKEVKHSGVYTYESAKAVWVEEKQCFGLSFHGRATIASIKNFQLVEADAESPDGAVLLLGRTDKNKFNLDFRAPMSPLQAFAIALSSLEGSVREMF